jgi:hypothetical protein
MRLPDSLKGLIGMRAHFGGTAFTGANAVQLRVPHVEQNHVNLCGDASAMMIMTWWLLEHGLTTEANPRGPLTGSSPEEHNLAGTLIVKWEFDPLPPPGQWTSRLLHHALITCGPIACSLAHRIAIGSFTLYEWGHCIVLTGVDVATDTLMFNDSWRGRDKPMPLADFNNQLNWRDDDCMAYVGGVR